MLEREIYCKPGDHIGVIPCNNQQLVDTIISRLKFGTSVDEYFKLKKFNEENNEYELVEKLPIVTMRQALTNYLDITTPLKKNSLSYLVDQASDIKDKNKIKLLVNVIYLLKKCVQFIK